MSAAPPITAVPDFGGAACSRPERRLRRALAGAVGKTFRGGIIENCKRFRFVGSGYDSMPPEQDRYFWIESAPHLRGPMAALTDELVRIVNIIGATQGLKSFCGDAWVPYVMEHERLPMMVLFEDEPKAENYCARRLVETLRRHPELARMFAVRARENRHNVTGTWLETPFSELLVGGLNDGNVSSLSWPRLWFSEGWLSGNKGLLKKGFKRADRYPTSSKILNESQASKVGTDLHEIASRAQPVPLEWACPACGGWQTWEWHHWSYQRASDFVPRARHKVAVINITSGEPGLNAQDSLLPALVETDIPKPGSYAGMIIADGLGGRRPIAERAALAYWECLHCGHHIHDTAAQRKALGESYRQNYRMALAGSGGLSPDPGPRTRTPPEVCFTLPWEANPGNAFAKTVTNFLIAKESKRQGNEVPEQDWFLSERALFFDPKQTGRQEMAIVTGSYDVNAIITDEHSRNMLIDVQKKLDEQGNPVPEDVPGSFWVIAEVVNKLGWSWDLGRYFCTSWEELRLIQRTWKIANGRVCIDGQKWTPEVQRRAATYYEWVDSAPMVVKMGYGKQFRQCWKIFIGDEANYYRHPGPGGKGVALKPYSPGHAHPVTIIEEGKSIAVTVYHYQWSNTAVKDQLHTILLGGEGLPKIHAISREQLAAQAVKYPELKEIIERTLAKEEGDRAYERQMTAEYRTEKRGKPFWDKKRPDNHYWDDRCQGGVRKMMDGLWGSAVVATAAAGVPDAAEKTVG